MENDPMLDFFSKSNWRQSIDRFKLSGMNLADEINALNPAVVVDVGCGFNPFKNRIRNLVGIDIANESADIVCDLMDAPFREASVDVALALGSINFGTSHDVSAALAKVAGWIKPGGFVYMRGNPGQEVHPEITIFPWSAENAVSIGRHVGLRVHKPVQEETIVDAWGNRITRLFWIYRKD
jgi:hypothetical protein